MNIGEAARRSGVSAKMIRYYESIGLLAPAVRTDANYRVYAEADVHTLQFIRSARSLGFPVPEVAELLALWRDRRRASASVKRMALSHVEALRGRIRELQDMAATLEHLAQHCHGDARPDCPILDELARTAPPAPAGRRKARQPAAGV